MPTSSFSVSQVDEIATEIKKLKKLGQAAPHVVADLKKCVALAPPLPPHPWCLRVRVIRFLPNTAAEFKPVFLDMKTGSFSVGSQSKNVRPPFIFRASDVSLMRAGIIASLVHDLVAACVGPLRSGSGNSEAVVLLGIDGTSQDCASDRCRC